MSLDFFWKHVAKQPGERCWVWTGSRNADGYGHITLKAHRLSYMLHYGPIPKGELVCHRCDNPACVRPDHLFSGTGAENARDRVSKGRSALPVFPSLHLTPGDCIAIGALRAGGLSLRAIARHLELPLSTVRSVLRTTPVATTTRKQPHCGS